MVHQAAIEGNLKLIKYLHGQGIKLNKKDSHGQTPMLLAALKGGCLQGNVYIDFPEPTPYYLHIYIDLVSLGNLRSSRSQPPRLRCPSIHSADIDFVSLGNHKSSRSQRPRLRYPSKHSAESAHSDHIIDQASTYLN